MNKKIVSQRLQLYILYLISFYACLETNREFSNTSFRIFVALINLGDLGPNNPNHWWGDSISNFLISDFAPNDVLLKLREDLRPSIINPSFIVFPSNLERLIKLKSNNFAFPLFSNF